MTSYNTQQLEQLDPPYLDQYGLKQAPFSNVHEDRFMYVDAERAQRLNMLLHLTQYSNLLLIVTAEHGGGKTSLMQRFMLSADDEWQLCQVNANTMMDADQLLMQIAEGFKLTHIPHDPDSLQATLYEHLAKLQRDSKVPILIIDDAHELPKDALEALFHLADAEAGNGNLLRSILFCEPQIETMLTAKAIQPLRERITHTMDIPALNEEQTAEYIKHRLAVCGFDGASPFSPKAIKKIHKLAQGIPARINEAAHRTLLDGANSLLLDPSSYQDSERTITPKRIVLGALTIAVIGIFLGLQDSINSLFENNEIPPEVTQEKVPKENIAVITRELPITPIADPVPAPTTSELQSSGVGDEAIETVIQAASTQTAVAPEYAQDQMPGTASAERVEASPQDTTLTEPAAIQITAVEPDPVTGSRKRQTITVIGNGFTQETKAIVKWSGNQKQLPPSRVIFESGSQLKLLITVGTKPDTWTIDLDDPTHGSSNTARFKVIPAKKVVSPLRPYRENWILARDPGHFTLQLLVTRQKNTIPTFIKTQRITHETAIFYSQQNGQDRYTLISGNFASRKQAATAASELRSRAPDSKPWIRRFDSVQASINSHRPSPTAAAATPPALTNLTDQVAWLWSQDPSSYTVQLLSSRRANDIQAFIRRHNLKGKAVYFHTQHNGQNWFALVSGVYPDQNTAQRSIKKLTGKLRQNAPWARSFASIHAELHRTDSATSQQ